VGWARILLTWGVGGWRKRVGDWEVGAAAKNQYVARKPKGGNVAHLKPAIKNRMRCSGKDLNARASPWTLARGTRIESSTKIGGEYVLKQPLGGGFQESR